MGAAAPVQDDFTEAVSGSPRNFRETTPVRVLLVEDNDAHALLIEAAIGQSDDCIIDRYATAEAAANAVRGFDAFDLMILDVALPGDKGIEFARRIRENATWSGIPIVIFSSSESAADHRSALDAGANSYVVKPLGYEAFESTVKDIVAYWTRLQYTPR
ncbi:MAG: response regulator [Phycisphaerales bacterium]|nr:response regulator [Phycisphaerales bacterium]